MKYIKMLPLNTFLRISYIPFTHTVGLDRLVLKVECNLETCHLETVGLPHLIISIIIKVSVISVTAHLCIIYLFTLVLCSFFGEQDTQCENL